MRLVCRSMESTRLRGMRAIALATALLLVPALVAACSDAKESDSKGGSTKLSDVTVSGKFGEKPTITFPVKFVGTDAEGIVVSKGTGSAVEAGQRIKVDYLAVSGDDGSELESTYDIGQQPLIVSKNTLPDSIYNVLVGTPVGSRVLFSSDGSAAGGPWIVVAMDIESATTLPASASGRSVAPPGDVPAVTVDNGVPKVAAPTGTPPSTLKVVPLIIGDGPAVKAGDSVVMNYVGVIWGSGKTFDSSWGQDPFEFVAGNQEVISGVDEGVIGQTVGSRVMIIIPPDKGYGPSGNSQAGIAGTDTLIFVVDILAAG